MNNIKFTFDPFQDKCTIEMNGEELPRYSDLNKYINQSLLVSGATLLQDVCDELNDDYDLRIVGTDFEKFFMGDLKTQHNECKTMYAEDFGTEVNLIQRFEQASKLLDHAGEDYKERIYTELEISIDQRLATQVSDLSNATICLAKDIDQAKEFAQATKAGLILYIAETASITYCSGNKCLWGIKEALLPRRIQATVERFAIPKFIKIAETVVQESENAEAKETVETLKNIGVRVVVSVAQEAYEGDVITPEFSADSELPVIRMETLHPQVVQIKGNKLVALGSGNATIRFYKDNEIEAFETVNIHIKADNLLKSISLSAPADMKPGREYQIAAELIPSDSPEVGNIKWSVSDTSIAQVDDSGNIKALRAGKVLVSASAERTSGSVEIVIVPGIEKITVSQEKVTIGIARKEIVEVELQPVGCDANQISCKSTNPKVAIAEKNDLGQWVITGKGITSNGEGRCQLIFAEEDGPCKAICEVTVISSIKQKEKKGAFLSRTAIATLLAFVIQFFGAPFGTYGAIALGAIAVVLGIVGIAKNRKDTFWEIVLMIISILIAVSNFLKI